MTASLSLSLPVTQVSSTAPFSFAFTPRHSSYLSASELLQSACLGSFTLGLGHPSRHVSLSGHPEKLPTLLCPADILVTNCLPCGYLAQNPQSLPQNSIVTGSLTTQYFYYQGKHFPFSSVTCRTSSRRRMNCTGHRTLHSSSCYSQRSNSLVTSPVIPNTVTHNRRDIQKSHRLADCREPVLINRILGFHFALGPEIPRLIKQKAVTLQSQGV